MNFLPELSSWIDGTPPDNEPQKPEITKRQIITSLMTHFLISSGIGRSEMPTQVNPETKKWLDEVFTIVSSGIIQNTPKIDFPQQHKIGIRSFLLQCYEANSLLGRCSSNWSILHLAAVFGDLDILNALLEMSQFQSRDFFNTLRNNLNDTPLSIAAEFGNSIGMIEALCDHISATTHYLHGQQTPFQHARHNVSNDALKIRCRIKILEAEILYYESKYFEARQYLQQAKAIDPIYFNMFVSKLEVDRELQTAKNRWLYIAKSHLALSHNGKITSPPASKNNSPRRFVNHIISYKDRIRAALKFFHNHQTLSYITTFSLFMVICFYLPHFALNELRFVLPLSEMQIILIDLAVDSLLILPFYRIVSWIKHDSLFNAAKYYHKTWPHEAAIHIGFFSFASLAIGYALLADIPRVALFFASETFLADMAIAVGLILLVVIPIYIAIKSHHKITAALENKSLLTLINEDPTAIWTLLQATLNTLKKPFWFHGIKPEMMHDISLKQSKISETDIPPNNDQVLSQYITFQ